MLDCPFCHYKTVDLYGVSLHVEEHHTIDSPFAIKDVDDASLSLARALQREEDEDLRHPVAPSPEPKDASTQVYAPGHRSYDHEVEYAECPYSGCGEWISLTNYNDHLELHAFTDSPSLSHTIAKMIPDHKDETNALCLPPNEGASANGQSFNMIEDAGKYSPESILSQTLSPFSHYNSTVTTNKTVVLRTNENDTTGRLGVSISPAFRNSCFGFITFNPN